jgi:hypothetical protein
MSQPSQLALFGTAAALLVSFVGASQAQSVIRFTNANNHEIPLAAGSTVNIDANGNLTAECALTSGVCTQLSNGGNTSGPVPTATLTRSASSIVAGSSVSLSWSSTDAVVCDATGSGPATTIWPGPRATANASGLGVVLSTAGDYLFNLRCYNAAGASVLQTVAVTATVPEGPVDLGCTITSTDPAFQPSGRVATEKSWVQQWSAPNGTSIAVYPNSIGSAVPVGANKGGYVVVPFVPTENLDVQIFWDVAQANSSIGYNPPRPADGMFITISPCRGDLRAPVANSSDPFLRPGCRIFANTAQLNYSTLSGNSNNTMCRLEAGKTYFMNVVAADPADGLSNEEHTCHSSTTGCDVQATHRKAN